MKTIERLTDAWRVLRDEDNGNALLGIVAPALTYEGVTVQVQITWAPGAVTVDVWDGDGVPLDSSDVTVPADADSNVLHCAALVGLARVGLTDIAPIAQQTARAVELAVHGTMHFVERAVRTSPGIDAARVAVAQLMESVTWLNDQLQTALKPLVCPTCKLPYVTIPQSIVLVRLDGAYYSGGEHVCWGRGKCAQRIVDEERARRSKGADREAHRRQLAREYATLASLPPASECTEGATVFVKLTQQYFTVRQGLWIVKEDEARS